MPSLERASNVFFCTNLCHQCPEGPKDTPHVEEHCPLYPARESWAYWVRMGTEGNRDVGMGAGGRRGPPGLDLSFPEIAGSPGPPLGGGGLLANEAVKA